MADKTTQIIVKGEPKPAEPGPSSTNASKATGSGEAAKAAKKKAVKQHVQRDKKWQANKKSHLPTVGAGARFPKTPMKIARLKKLITSTERLPCERCHQEQRPLPPEFMYVHCGRCPFRGQDVFYPYRRLRQDKHVFYTSDYGASLDITDLRLLDGKLVSGPQEDFSRERLVAFDTIMDSMKNIVRRK